MPVHTISAVSRMPVDQIRSIYQQLVPPELLERFSMAPDLRDAQGRDLLSLNTPRGAAASEMALRHQADFPDPILYGHIADTVNGQIHVLLYILNDPASPRFDVDRLPDGTPTKFGTVCRNLQAEAAALEFGLAPGQVRKGLRMLGEAIRSFETFVASLGHDMYFAEPLFYHNAVIFERYGFAYERGRKLMERVHAGFAPGGDLLPALDNSTPFRSPAAADSIRLRSWALHDGLLGEPFNQVAMYKRIGKSSDQNTCPGCGW